jgi:hypothetical protein
MQSICVFCGSSPGRHPGYLKLASECGGLREGFLGAQSRASLFVETDMTRLLARMQGT